MSVFSIKKGKDSAETLELSALICSMMLDTSQKEIMSLVIIMILSFR